MGNETVVACKKCGREAVRNQHNFICRCECGSNRFVGVSSGGDSPWVRLVEVVGNRPNQTDREWLRELGIKWE